MLSQEDTMTLALIYKAKKGGLECLQSINGFSIWSSQAEH